MAKGIIDCINYNKMRGFVPCCYGVYLLEVENYISGYVHTAGEGLWEFIYKEKGRDVPHTYNWVEITDWFRDRPEYTKKELAEMIYHFYEVVA